MVIQKQYIAAVMAAASLAVSCMSLQAFRYWQSNIENLVNVSQLTVQTNHEQDFVEQDKAGVLLLQSMTAPEDGNMEFPEIDSSCDGKIKTAIADAQRLERTKREMKSRPGMIGRLVIPGAGIDVALVRSFSASTDQAIADARDSACVYAPHVTTGPVLVADHNNQEFRTLSRTTQGMTAYIQTDTGRINLVCSVAMNGINDGFNIRDMNGNVVEDIADFVCYTCQQDWHHVRIVGLNRA